ncbi:MAG: flagellar basal body P-ring formation chaperone FlgA [Gammaproteobacteria bacterium]
MPIPDRIARTGGALWRIAFCLALPAAVHAAGQQDPAAVQAQAERFLKTQSAGLPGKVTVKVQSPRAALPACAALDAFQAPGVRSIGRTTVGVRCLAPQRWTVYLAAQVSVMGHYVVTRGPLRARQEISADDLLLREGDLGALPADVATDPQALVGFRTVSGIAAGAPLRAGLLRPPLVVQQGQPTRLVMSGPGFTVQSEGQAMANASRGDRVRVKTRSGQIVSGIAHDGQQVVVTF